MAKTHDLVVKVGSYTNREGEEKPRYENIGAIIEGKNGAYIMLRRTFNPAGVPDSDGRDSVIVSMFEVKDDAERTAKQVSRPSGFAAATQGVDLDDEIPF